MFILLEFGMELKRLNKTYLPFLKSHPSPKNEKNADDQNYVTGRSCHNFVIAK